MKYEIQISERTVAFGDKQFINSVAIPVATEMEKIGKEYPCSEENKPEIEAPRPQAFLTELGGMVAIPVVFVGGWLANKFLDELYDASIGPAVKSHFRDFFKSKRNKKYSLSILVRRSEGLPSVLICCVGETIEEIEASEACIVSALKLAESYISSESKECIFLLVIDNGKLDVNPKKFDGFESALNGLKGMYPAKPPGHISRS